MHTITSDAKIGQRWSFSADETLKNVCLNSRWGAVDWLFIHLYIIYIAALPIDAILVKFVVLAV